MADENTVNGTVDGVIGQGSIHRVLKVYIGSELVYSNGKRVVQESEKTDDSESEGE